LSHSKRETGIKIQLVFPVTIVKTQTKINYSSCQS
jgi:hypothetical protein